MIELRPDATDSEKVTLVRNIAHDCIFKRQPFLDRIARNWDLYIGNHWMVEPPPGHEKVTLNYVGTLLDNLVSFLIGQNPEFEPWPVDGAAFSEDVYKIVNRLMKSWWHRHDFKSELDVFVRNVANAGVGIMGFLPPDFDDPEPDVKANPIDIFSCGFDLTNRHWDFQRGEYFLTVTMENRRMMENAFGVEVSPGSDFEDNLRLERQRDIAPIARARGSANLVPHYTSSSGSVEMSDSLSDVYPRTGHYSKDEVMVTRMYFRDFTKVREVQNPTYRVGGQTITAPVPVTREKYPGGIRVITIAGETLLEDAASPFQKGYFRGRFPFVQGNFIKRADSPYGIGFPDRLEDVQIQLNRKSSLLFDWLSQLPKTPLIIPNGLGIDASKINSRTGLILRPNNALFSRYIRFLNTPSVSPAVVEAIKELLVHMERIGGLPDVSEGRRPTGITAASAIIALQEKSKQKFQHQVRNVESFLSGLGNGVMGGMEQYYIEPQPYYGFDDMGTPELLKYGGTANISPALLLSTGKYRVRVRGASTLDISKYAIEERMVQLHGMGIISDEDLVEALDVPGKERIKSDLQKRKLIAQLEAMVNSPIGQPGAGPGAIAPPPPAAPAGRGQGAIGKPTSENVIKGQAERRAQNMRSEAKARG